MKKLIYTLFFILASLIFTAGAQTNPTDSIFVILKNSKEDTAKVNAFNALGLEWIKQSQYDSAIYYLEAGLALAGKINFDKGKGIAYARLGHVFYQKGNLTKAISKQYLALKVFEKTGNRRNLANTYNNIAIDYMQLGNYTEAQKNYLASLKINEEIGNEDGIGATLINIGIIYLKEHDYPEALKHLFKGLEIDQKRGNKDGMSYAYGNIGVIYVSQNKYSEALKYHRMALKIKEEMGDKSSIARSLTNIGTVYEAQGDSAGDAKDVVTQNLKYAEALKQHRASIKIFESINDKIGITASGNNIGVILIKQKKFGEAGAQLSADLLLAKEVGDMELIMNNYKNFEALNTAQNNFKEAFNNYKLYIAYRDSLLNDENTKKTVQMQMQYQFSKQQVADSIRNTEKANQEQLKHQQEINQQKTYTYGGIVGFLLMIIVAGVSFRAFKQKQKDNHIITEQKKLVDEKQKEILDSILYAKRIQTALITNEKYIGKSIERLKKES